MKTVLVTGASGFVGRALCASLIQQGINVRAVVRDISKDNEPDFAIRMMHFTKGLQQAATAIANHEQATQ